MDPEISQGFFYPTSRPSQLFLTHRFLLPPSFSKNNQGLIAFIFAVVSHGTADIAWHSLMGISDGFIVELAALDQHFSYELAHEIADTGGDFTLRHSATLPYLVPNWRIPVNDIVKVYERLYSNGGKYVPPASAIQSCMTAAFAASQADQRLGQYLFGYYGTKSPFLIREMEDYYRGGEYLSYSFPCKIIRFFNFEMIYNNSCVFNVYKIF